MRTFFVRKGGGCYEVIERNMLVSPEMLGRIELHSILRYLLGKTALQCVAVLHNVFTKKDPQIVIQMVHIPKDTSVNLQELTEWKSTLIVVPESLSNLSSIDEAVSLVIKKTKGIAEIDEWDKAIRACKKSTLFHDLPGDNDVITVN